MSNRQLTTETRTLHPRALNALGEEACIVMLGVAADLRSGVIPPENYDQSRGCGTSCCIAGHTMYRLGEDGSSPWMWKVAKKDSSALSNLFSGAYPSNPQRAARAIERYIYEGADKPWA